MITGINHDRKGDENKRKERKEVLLEKNQGSQHIFTIKDHIIFQNMSRIRKIEVCSFIANSSCGREFIYSAEDIYCLIIVKLGSNRDFRNQIRYFKGNLLTPTLILLRLIRQLPDACWLVSRPLTQYMLLHDYF